MRLAAAQVGSPKRSSTTGAVILLPDRANTWIGL
jgi:hypothetical protein